MREHWELRIRNEHAPEPDLLAGGRMLGGITQLKLDGGDPVRVRLVAQHRARKAAGQAGLISQAILTRRYSRDELERASLFQLLWTRMFDAVRFRYGLRSGAELLCLWGSRSAGGTTPASAVRHAEAI